MWRDCDKDIRIWQDYDKHYKVMTRLWQGLFECDKIMTRTIIILQDYDMDYKKMTTIWQGLNEYNKNRTRTIRKWQEYNKDYKKMTRVWQELTSWNWKLDSSSSSSSKGIVVELTIEPDLNSSIIFT